VHGHEFLPKRSNPQASIIKEGGGGFLGIKKMTRGCVLGGVGRVHENEYSNVFEKKRRKVLVGKYRGGGIGQGEGKRPPIDLCGRKEMPRQREEKNGTYKVQSKTKGISAKGERWHQSERQKPSAVQHSSNRQKAQG